MSATTIGNTLKEAREKKSLTLDEVHAKIKIHPRVIQLLEEGKLEKLPSPLFAKSFLRSYADFLGVNPEEVMNAYSHEAEAVRKEPEQVLFIKSVDEKKEDNWAKQNIFKVSALVAALVLAGLLFSFAAKPISAWFHQIKIGNHGLAWNRPAAGKKSPVKEAVPAKEKPLKNPLEWVRSVEQGNFPKLSKKTPLEFRLRALDNVWIKVTSDGKVAYQGILGRNAVQTWQAKSMIELWTGNASNMFLSVNRYSLGSPGRGMIRKMVITHEGVYIPAAENH